MTFGVGGKCQVCTHAAVEAIDAALVAGSGTYALIASEHALTTPAIAHHSRKHLTRRIAKGLVPAATSFSNDVLAHVKRHLSRTHYLSVKLEAKGDERGAVAAMREYRHGAALLARVLGDLPEPASVTINILQDPRFRSAMATVMREVPAELRPRLAAAVSAGVREPA